MNKPVFGEVCLCVLITGVIVAFMAPAFTNNRSRPSRTPALSQIKQSTMSVMLYTGDYDDLFPYVTSPAQLVEVTFEYSKNREIWQTMNVGKPGIFVYNKSLPGASLMEVDMPADVPMILDPYARRASEQSTDWIFLTSYADGHARFVPQKSWAPVQANLTLKLKRHGKPIGGRK